MKLKATPTAGLSHQVHAGIAPRVAQRSRLGLEIAVALAVKLALLFALHQLWFADPQSRRLTEPGVAAALLGPAHSPSRREERPDGSGH